MFKFIEKELITYDYENYKPAEEYEKYVTNEKNPIKKRINYYLFRRKFANGYDYALKHNLVKFSRYTQCGDIVNKN